MKKGVTKAQAPHTKEVTGRRVIYFEFFSEY